MNSETTVTTNKANKILNGHKLCNLKVVLPKINVGKCILLPGKVGYSIQYLPSAAINLNRKRLVPVAGNPSKRKSRRILDTSPCCSGYCLGCTSGKRCSKLKQTGPKVKYTATKRSKYERTGPKVKYTATKRSKYERTGPKVKYTGTKRSKYEQRKQIARHQPDSSLGALYKNETSTLTSLHSASCFIGEGELQQTLHMVTPARQVDAYQLPHPVGVVLGSGKTPGSSKGYHLHTFLPDMSSSLLQQWTTPDSFSLPETIPEQTRSNHSVVSGTAALGNVTGASRHRETSTSVRVPDTVHVIFSHEDTLKEQNSLPLSTFNTRHPSENVPSPPGTASSLIRPVNNGVVSSQQYRLPSTATSAHKGLPLLPSGVNAAPAQPQTAVLPHIYPPAAIPLYHGWQQSGIQCVPMATDTATGLPVYRLAQPFSVATQTDLTRPPTGSSMSNSIGSPIIRNLPPVQSVSINQNSSSFATIAPAPQRNRLQEASTAAATQDASQFPTGERASARTRTVEEACDQLTQVLKKVTKEKKIRGDFRFLVDHYRSSFKQDPSNTIIIDGLQSLRAFLRITECKFKAESYSLQKSCLSLQSLVEQYQKSIRADGDKYKKLLHNKLSTEKNINSFENFITTCKQREVSEMEAELSGLEVKMAVLTKEKDELYEKWLQLADSEATKQMMH